MKIYRIVIVLVLSAVAFPLLGQPVQGDFEYGFMSGTNFVKYSNAIDVGQTAASRIMGEEFSAVPGFSAGLFLKTPRKRNFRLKGVGYYGLHSGRIENPSYLLRNQYAAASAMLEYRIFDDLWVHLGLNYTHLLTSRLYSGGTLTEDAGNANSNPYGFQNEINPLIGFELRLASRSHIELNYIHPATDQFSRNVQISLYFAIDRYINEPSQRKLDNEAAHNQISELKNGVLLVRLSTSTAKINAYKSIGKEAEAAETEKEQRSINLEIMQAFKRKFDFCRVEFFLATDSRKVREDNLKGIFLDENLNVDSTITVDPRQAVYAAEFGSTGGSSSGGIDISALVIMDRNLVKLQKPFPYYTRALFTATDGQADKTFLAVPLLPFTPMTYDRTVEKMNKSLHEYHTTNRQF